MWSAFVKKYENKFLFFRLTGLFLCIGIICLAGMHWQSSWRPDCVDCMSKKEFLYILSIFFGLVYGIFFSAATLAFLLGGFIHVALSKWPAWQAKLDFSALKYLKFIGILTAASTVTFAIVAAVVYRY